MSRFDDNPLEELGQRVIPILSAITIARFPWVNIPDPLRDSKKR